MDGQSGPEAHEKLDDATIFLIPLSQLVESPTNPRKTLGDLTGLTQSIQAQGFRPEHPLLVRPHPDHDEMYEIISGHRRLAASKLAGLDAAPCIIDDVLSTGQILQVQLIENAQRADVHPLEEAQAFKRLRDEHSLPLSMIAHRIGKSESHVSRRLSLTRLCEQASGAYASDSITLEVAIELSRLPTAQMQIEALEEIVRPKNEYERDRSPRKIIELVRAKYFLRLSSTPWALDDATLLHGATACTVCPKRTGSQPALFSDLDGVDTCTDHECFAAKGAAAVDRRVVEWQAKGAHLVTAEEAKMQRVFFNTGGDIPALHYGRIELSDECDEPSAPEGANWVSLIGPHLPPEQVWITIDSTGRARELVMINHARALLKEHHAWARGDADDSADEAEDGAEEEGEEIPHSAGGPSSRATSPTASKTSSAAKWEAERQAERERDAETHKRIVAIVAERASSVRDETLYLALCHALATGVRSSAIDALYELVKVKLPFGSKVSPLTSRLEHLCEQTHVADYKKLMLGLLVANITSELGDWSAKVEGRDKALLERLGIDPATIAGDVKAGRPAPKLATTKAPKVATAGRVKPGPKPGTKTGPKVKPVGKVTVHKSRKK